MADGVCWMQKRRVEDGHVCMAFSRKMEQEPIQAAPPVKPVLDLPAEIVTEPARSVRHRPRFNFAAWVRQVLKINRLGRSNFHFPAQLHGDEVNTNQERKTHEERI